MSPRPRLSRLFRKEVGVSFVQYLTALRLRHAADQLLTTRKTVQQIAREQGFASTRMMSDLFKRQHGVTPRQYREQHPLELARPRPPQADRWQPVAADRLYARLNEPEPRDRESPPLPINPPQTREINLRDRPARPAALRHTRMVVTVRELDDLLREDVRRELEQLHHALPVYAIDINDPFLSSRLFGTGWDDPQMAGYACWYNLQQIFSWLAAMGWQVILHTGVTTRSDLLQRFLQLAANHFPPATLNSWRFVWHWSPQASEAARREPPPAAAARGPSSPAAAAAAGDLAPLCSQRSRERSAVPLAAAGRGGFSRLPGRCQRTAGSGPGQTAAAPASSEHYPLHKLRQIHSALRQRQLNLPLWLLSWNTLTGDTRDTNGRFFRGALLMDNLLGVADRGLAGGLLVKFRPPGRSSRQRQARYLQPGAALSARPAAPGLLGTLALAAAARRDPRFTIKTCCCSTTEGHYQLLLRNTVVYNPRLSSEAAFIQRFSQPYSVRLQGLGWQLAHQTAPVRSAPRRVVPAGGRLSQPQRP